MFTHIPFKKILIGSAVVGGLAVAGYYSYKWFMEDTESKIDEKHDNETGSPVNATDEQTSKSVVSEEDDKATDAIANAIQRQEETQSCCDTTKIQDDKTVDQSATMKNDLKEAATSAIAAMEADKEVKDTKGTEDVATTSGAEINSDRVTVTEVVQDGGKARGEADVCQAVESREAAQVVDEELGACRGATTERKVDKPYVPLLQQIREETLERIANMLGGEWATRIRTEGKAV